MSLQIIKGPSGCGKSRLLFTTALSRAKQNPDKRFIVLVPEQFTMSTQRELAELSDCGGILNIDVLSFTRLAWRVFEQTGHTGGEVLSETGKSLILRLIASREEGKLPLLNGVVDKPGALAEIKSILSEMDQYGIDAEKLKEMEERLRQDRNHLRLAGKLEELRKVQEAFEQYLQDRFLTGEKLLRVLCRKAPLDSTLKGCEFFLDGYTGFTPAQLDVITTLLPIAGKMTVTVTVGEGRPELFALSFRTMETLRYAAERARVPMEQEISPEAGCGRLKTGSELAYLEQNLMGCGRIPYPDSEKEKRQVVFRACTDPYEEAVCAAVKILELVRKGMRFREIGIVCGSMKDYAEYVRRVFTMYRIPFYIDRTSPVVLNPAFEFIMSAIAVLDANFSYESMMRFLRTGFFTAEDLPDRSEAQENEAQMADDGNRTDTAAEIEAAHAIDRLDNYLLAAGIRGHKAWSNPFVRLTKSHDQLLLETAEQLRCALMERFEPFAEVMKKSRAKCRDYARAVWQLTEAFDVPKKLDRMREEAEAAGHAAHAKEYEQVVRVIAKVLDEAVGLIGEEKVTRRQFTEILRAGFSEAKIGTIPPGIDEVHVGDLERTRLEHIRALLFLGMNDSFVPAVRKTGGLLTDMEREILSGQQMHLAPTIREDAKIQQYYLYLTLTKPSELLCLSWSMSSRSGETMRPAYLLSGVRSLFPEKDRLLPPLKTEERAANLRTGLSVLSSQLSEYLESGAERRRSMEPELKELLKLYLPDPQSHTEEDELSRQQSHAEEDRLSELQSHTFLKQTVRSILNEMEKERSFPKLPEETARLLYGSVISGSITRLEEFASCPFRHFADYGLRLAERETFTIRGADIGSVLHQAIELFSGRVLDAPDMSWNSMTDQVRDTWAEESVREAILLDRTALYEDSQRSLNVLDRMIRIMQRSVKTIQYQVRAGAFYPAHFEVMFDSDRDIQEIRTVDLPGNAKMRLTGRIDRIDLCDDSENRILYVKIVDYKSSPRSLDLDSLIDGEQLQLAVYMDAAMSKIQKQHPDRTVTCAGLLYSAFQDPVLDASEIKDSAEAAFLGKMRVTGLVNEDPKVIHLMDEKLAPGEKSLAIPVKLKTDGTISSQGSSAVSDAQLEEMRCFAREKMKASASSILKGEIRPYPSRRGADDTACRWCTFRDVCGFDPTHQDRYNDRIKRDDVQRWKAIRAGAEKDVTHE